MCSNMHFLGNVRKSYDAYSLCLLYLGSSVLYAQRCQSIFTCHVHLLIHERRKERQGHVSQLSLSPSGLCARGRPELNTLHAMWTSFLSSSPLCLCFFIQTLHFLSSGTAENRRVTEETYRSVE